MMQELLYEALNKSIATVSDDYEDVQLFAREFHSQGYFGDDKQKVTATIGHSQRLSCTFKVLILTILGQTMI